MIEHDAASVRNGRDLRPEEQQRIFTQAYTRKAFSMIV